MVEPRWLQWLPAPLRNLEPGRWWFLPPIAVGLVVLVLAMVLSPGTRHDAAIESSTPVRVRTLEPTSVSPTFTGYGQVQPVHQWRAVAEVPGSVQWRNPRLKAGATFETGETLLEIDSRDYEVAVSRAEAQRSAARASIAEFESRHKDLGQSLEIEREALEIAEADYERNRQLAEDGHISEVRLGQERQALLRQRQAVKNIETQLNLVPLQLESARARLQEAEATLSKARQDVVRTKVTMPFDGRIEQVMIDDAQFVPLGQPMLVAEGTRDLEVLVQAPWDELEARFPAAMQDTEAADLDAVLSHASGRQWRGRVARIDPGLSRANRSAQIYVSIDIEKGESPPAPYQYLEVRLSGSALEDRFEVPRTSLRDGRLMLADADAKLALRNVTVDYIEQDRAIISGGVGVGDRVVVSDVLYPVAGMQLDPRPEEHAP